MSKFNVAILGASGVVGQSLLKILHERNFPIAELFPLGRSHSEGDFVDFAGRSKEIIDVEKFDWSQAHIAFFSAGSEASLKWAPIATEQGCIVIDNTSAFRQDHDVPLIIPEVNPERIADFRQRYIIANPNCSTIQMLVALKPIYDAVGIERIHVSTYQSVSGTGKKAIEELSSQCVQMLQGKPAEPQVYPRQIAFNVIPQIDEFMDNDFTKEEMKMHWETQKILGDDRVNVNATAVRVPVFFGHSESIYVQTQQAFDVAEIKSLLKEAPGLTLLEQNHEFPTPVPQGSGQDSVYVGRVRQDISHPYGLNLWVVADNVRKGAALNSIQIAEHVLEYLI